ERHAHDHAVVAHGLADGLAGGGVPDPRGTVVAAGDDCFAVWAERRGPDRILVRKYCLESGMLGAPCRQIGPRGALPVGIAGGDRRFPALDHPEQARTNLAFLERRLAAIEVANRQRTIRCGERRREAAAFLAKVGIETG